MTTTTKHPMTLSEYWQMHGYSKEEADRIEREQISDAMRQSEEEDLYDAGIWNCY